MYHPSKLLRKTWNSASLPVCKAKMSAHGHCKQLSMQSFAHISDRHFLAGRPLQIPKKWTTQSPLANPFSTWQPGFVGKLLTQASAWPAKKKPSSSWQKPWLQEDPGWKFMKFNDKWDLFMETPTEWYDNRKAKRSDNSPDFVHRKHSTRGLWLFAKDTRDPIPYLERLGVYQQIQDWDADNSPHAQKPKPALSVWDELFERTYTFKDKREVKVHEKQPDFVSLETGRALWLNSAPSWVKKRLPELTKKRFTEKPKITFPEELRKAGTSGEEISSLHVLQIKEEVEKDLEWSEADSQKSIDVILGAEPADSTEEASPPLDVVKKSLWVSQRRSLAWMIRMERAGSPPGGMLCDEQGLGKTPTAISLIATRSLDRVQAEERLKLEVSDVNPETTGTDNSSIGERLSEIEGDNTSEEEEADGPLADLFDGDSKDLPETVNTEVNLKATLVIMPKNLLNQWELTLKSWAPSLKVLVYSEARRDNHQDPVKLEEYDVVLASYGIALHDSPEKQDKVLFKVAWWRIIFDEAHNIRNKDAQTSKAISLLAIREGGSRWLLTGTPISNEPQELFMYFHILRYEPFCHEASFRKLFKAKEGELGIVLERLKSMLRPVMRRWTKTSTIDGEVIVPLPEKLVSTQAVELSADERLFYDFIEDDAIDEIKSGSERQALKLQLATKLRRACNNPRMVLDLFEDMDEKGVLLPEELQDAYSRWTADEPESSKLKSVMRIIKAYQDDEKILVYSQWTYTLDLLEASLLKDNIKYARLDGTMSSAQRVQAIDKFTNQADVPVFLISLLSGNAGLNLQQASRVIFTEPHFNPKLEWQAMDRAHRFGQDRVVHVHKLIIKDSIEESIIKLQEHKILVSEEVTGTGKSDFASKDLEFLFKSSLDRKRMTWLTERASDMPRL